MKHQLKIIMSYEEKDGAIQPITTPNIIVYRDDRPIGCIQNIKFQANVKELLPQLEFTFPNFRDQNIDNVASSFMVEVDDFIKTLSSIPNTKVIVETQIQKLMFARSMRSALMDTSRAFQ